MLREGVCVGQLCPQLPRASPLCAASLDGGMVSFKFLQPSYSYCPLGGSLRLSAYLRPEGQAMFTGTAIPPKKEPEFVTSRA